MAASSSAIRPEPRTAIIPSRGEHRVTMLWFHDMRANISFSLHLLTSLNLNNVEWICLSSQLQFLTYDQDELDRKAKDVADLFLAQPRNVIKGVGGLGVGAVVALHFATNCALGHYPFYPRVVVGVNGWLSMAGHIKSRIESTVGAADRAALQSIFLTHESVPYSRDELEAAIIREAGFRDVKFVPFQSIEAICHEVKFWLKEKLVVLQ